MVEERHQSPSLGLELKTSGNCCTEKSSCADIFYCICPHTSVWDCQLQRMDMDGHLFMALTTIKNLPALVPNFLLSDMLQTASSEPEHALITVLSVFNRDKKWQFHENFSTVFHFGRHAPGIFSFFSCESSLILIFT